MRWIVGEWLVDDETDTLERGADRRKLERRAMHVLTCLIGRAGAVLTRDELIEIVWGRTAISDHSVAIVISQLRRVLGDDRRAPRYIETIPKRGYRLIAPVRPASPGEPPTVHAEGVSTGARRLRCIAGAALAALLALTGIGLVAAKLMWSRSAAEPARHQLLVSDFVNATGAPENDHLAFAFGELVSTGLSQDAANTVVRRRASEDARLVGGGGRLVTGRLVGDVGDPVLVVQVSDLASRRLIFAESYPIRDASIAARGREIARDVGASLGEDLPELADPHPFPAQAHELYWRARYLWSRRAETSAREARDILVQLLRAYPDYGPAHAALADIYAHKTGEHLGLARADTFAEAQKHLNRAVALMGSSSETDVTRALLAFYRDHDATRALSDIDDALRRNPNNALAWQTRGMLDSVLGRDQDALQAIDRAAAIDPVSESIPWDRVWFLYVAHRYEDALREAETARRTSAPVYLYLALTYEALSRPHEALQAWIDRAQAHGLSEPARAAAERALQGGRAGPQGYAALLDAEASDPNYHENGAVLAVLAEHAGRPDLARAALSRPTDPRDGWLLAWRKRLPILAALSDDNAAPKVLGS
jgi:DNA-binding winged helix-turn-helix (wHTH) protein